VASLDFYCCFLTFPQAVRTDFKSNTAYAVNVSRLNRLGQTVCRTHDRLKTTLVLPLGGNVRIFGNVLNFSITP